MDVTKQIVKAIRTEYPENLYDIYTEPIEQGFTEPCFSIRLVNESSTQYPGGRTLLVPNFDVRYFPSSHRPNKECREIASNLWLLLRSLTGARGTGMTWEIVDNVLHFFVSYPHFVREISEQGAMDDIETSYTTGG